jgi:hypothetical protein
MSSPDQFYDVLPLSQDSRIWFAGNPWPEGHPVRKFEWKAEIREGIVWMLMHLETADYYSERRLDDGDTEHDSEWEAPNVWGNYHRCILASGGIPVCSVAEFSTNLLDGYEAVVDPLPEAAGMAFNELAFQIYLLGHDSVADHRIRFVRRGGSDRFDIEWTGRIALTYAGDYEFRHDFKARIIDVQAPQL